MARHPFVLVGGNPALDFVNTVHDWTVPEPRDYFTEFPDAMRFGEAAGILTRGEARQASGRRPQEGLRRLHGFRARLERIFRAATSAKTPSAADLHELSREAAAAASAARLFSSRGQVRRVVAVEAAGAAVLRWRIAEAAVDLLTSSRLMRVKSCPRCGWFFLDLSKNHSRRWCSMAMCGSLTKARRYYWRNKRNVASTSGS